MEVSKHKEHTKHAEILTEAVHKVMDGDFLTRHHAWVTPHPTKHGEVLALKIISVLSRVEGGEEVIEQIANREDPLTGVLRELCEKRYQSRPKHAKMVEEAVHEKAKEFVSKTETIKSTERDKLSSNAFGGKTF